LLKEITLRKFMEGYLVVKVSKKGDICLHCRLDAALKWTTDAPAISNIIINL